jgi:hypothetical protein
MTSRFTAVQYGGKSKSQIPNPKEISNINNQTGNSRAARFEIWSLEFPWDLELGLWDFPRA